MTQFVPPSILDPPCLYLSYNPRRKFYHLCIARERFSKPADILLIHDILVEAFDSELRYFVIRYPAKYTLSAQSPLFVVGARPDTSPDSVISEFYRLQPNFELCSPGFSRSTACLKWGLARTKCSKKEFHKKYSIMKLKWCDIGEL